MKEVFWDTLRDGALMAPWLFGVYLLVAFLERRMGHGVHHRLVQSGAIGPIVGMLVGLLPQCGFSVVAAALYSQRLITVGTLVAVLLATSDEALPLILSHPARGSLLLPLLGGKMVIATVGGYLVDLLFRSSRFAPESCGHDHEHSRETGCCHHDVPGGGKSFEFLAHPVKHTVSVFAFFVVTSMVLGGLLHSFGEERLSVLLLRGSLLQPIVASLVGLIPNCAVSVVITQSWLAGQLGSGAAMAGLCSSGGLGLLVLAKESRHPRDVVRVIGVLWGISCLAGIVIQVLFG